MPVRNEGPFLLEWVAHYLGAGVTDFLIFSNDCEDGTDAILDLLAAEGIVTHQPIKAIEGQSVQWQALKSAWKHPLRKSADWMMVLDADEFLNIHAGTHQITDLINAVPENTQAIALPWRLFGNAGQVYFEDALTTKTFTASMPEICNHPLSSNFFKTLFRPDGPFNQLGIHRPQQKKDRTPHWVDGSGIRMDAHVAADAKQLTLYGQKKLVNDQGRSLVELNHYSIRSAENFMVKRARGLPNRRHKKVDLAYWTDRNFNSEPNNTIQNMAENTTPQLAKLRVIPGMIEAHENAVSWHREKFQTLMLQEPEFQLFSQLLVAGDSAVLPQNTVSKLIKMFQRLER